MSSFVVDNSVVMSWAFEDEASSYADAVLDSLVNARAVVPSLWPIEVANVLVVAERRGRISEGDSLRFLSLLRALPVQVAAPATPSARELLSVARDYGLSAYDAAYLQLSIENGLPMASLDERLRDAAERAGVSLWLPAQA